MIQTFAQATEAVTTGSTYTGVDGPMIVALVFGLSGAFFVGIYCLRRSRQKVAKQNTV